MPVIARDLLKAAEVVLATEEAARLVAKRSEGSSRTPWQSAPNSTAPGEW